MPVSSVPAVKAKILTLLQAAQAEGQGLEGVSVDWADPSGDIAHEHIFMTDPFIEESAAALATTRPRKELYTLPVLVHVRRDGNDAQAAEERMWELVAEVEAIIGGATNLDNVGGVLTAQIEQKIPETFPHDQARVALCAIPIRVEARI